jgi:hypothetical protein
VLLQNFPCRVSKNFLLFPCHENQSLLPLKLLPRSSPCYLAHRLLHQHSKWRDSNGSVRRCEFNPLRSRKGSRHSHQINQKKK